MVRFKRVGTGENVNQKHISIKDLPLSERPDEKCVKYGVECLSDAELLAIIIRTGSRDMRSVELAQSVLMITETKRGLAGLNYLGLEDLTAIKGIGKVKALQILAVLELTKRMAKSQLERNITFDAPDVIASYFMQDVRHLQREEVRIIMLDGKNRLIKECMISKGTINSSLLSPREIFTEGIRYGAVSVILLHNHPSGDPTPSREDIIVTKRIQEAGNLLGIPLMDHIIIGDNKFISLKEKGIL